MNDINPEMLAEIRRLRRFTLWSSILNAILFITVLAAGCWLFAHRSTPSLVNNPAAAPTITSSAIPAVSDKSIAVLPFQSLGDNRQNVDFADSVPQEILSKLAQVADLRVISSNNVMQHKTALTRSPREVGQQLGVAYLLEGSVRRVHNRVRVTVQLIDAARDETVWEESYESEAANVFAVESEIAKAIADQLGVKLSLVERWRWRSEVATRWASPQGTRINAGK
jgi:TolB-like protein